MLTHAHSVCCNLQHMLTVSTYKFVVSGKNKKFQQFKTVSFFVQIKTYFVKT